MNDIKFDSKYFDIEQEEQRTEFIRKHFNSEPMNDIEKLAHFLWIEYQSARFLDVKETNDKFFGNLSLPNFPLIDNTDEYIELIIKQLQDIKKNKILATELVRQLYFNDIWRKILIELEYSEERYKLTEYEYNILRKVYQNKKTKKHLAYIYNLKNVYCKKENKVFDIDENKPVNADIEYKRMNDITEKEHYKMIYGNYKDSLNANKKELERIKNYLIDNEQELLNYLGFHMNEKGNLTTNIITEKGIKRMSYRLLCKRIQYFLNNGTHYPEEIRDKIAKDIFNDTLAEIKK